jgi:hypothetical protein
MSTLEDKLAAGIAQVKNTSRARKTPAKATVSSDSTSVAAGDQLPAASVSSSAAIAKANVPKSPAKPAVQPVTPTKVVETPKRVYLADDRVWPD